MAINKILIALCLIFSGVANAEIIRHFNGFNVVQADARYVLKSGDTMTGPLTTPSVAATTITTNSGQSLLYVTTQAYFNANTYIGGPIYGVEVPSLVAKIKNLIIGAPSNSGIQNTNGNGFLDFGNLDTDSTLIASGAGSRAKQATYATVIIGSTTSGGNPVALAHGHRTSYVVDAYVNSSNNVIVNNSLGIGTTAPATKTHIVGELTVSTQATLTTGYASWQDGAAKGVYATNNSGAAMSSGTVVQPFASLNGLSITTSSINSDYPIGTIYDDSCANGALCKVCTEGICPARLITTGACAITNVYVKAGGEVGRAECATIEAGVAHNDEIGQPATFTSSNGAVIQIWAHRN